MPRPIFLKATYFNTVISIPHYVEMYVKLEAVVKKARTHILIHRHTRKNTNEINYALMWLEMKITHTRTHTQTHQAASGRQRKREKKHARLPANVECASYGNVRRS